MNKEISPNNYQGRSHQEGQQNNIAQQHPDGTSNPPTLNDQQENRETESDRAQREDNDSTTREGNSSI